MELTEGDERIDEELKKDGQRREGSDPAEGQGGTGRGF